jgi:hypothetical protein
MPASELLTARRLLLWALRFSQAVLRRSPAPLQRHLFAFENDRVTVAGKAHRPSNPPRLFGAAGKELLALVDDDDYSEHARTSDTTALSLYEEQRMDSRER